MQRITPFLAVFLASGPVLLAKPANETRGAITVDATWQDAIGADLRRLEYALSPAKCRSGRVAWQAPNRAQNLRATFTAAGVRLTPRTADGERFEWTMRLIGLGREGALDRLPGVEPAEPIVSGNRVEYRRGGVVEWYLNDARGLEQGFTLEAPPEALDGLSRGGGKLVLELECAGTLEAVLRDGGVDLLSEGGSLGLRYDHLAVFDADGRAIEAGMEVEGRSIRITVDDRHARYPLTIDPLATNPSWTAESDQANARFGTSVASAGDVDGDGYSDVVVGAPLFDGGEIDEGRAFLYRGSATGLALTAAWTAESDQVSARFGTSVAGARDVDGDGFDDVVIGAEAFGNGQAQEGRVYLYRGSATGLAATPAWTAESDLAGAQFGHAVAGAGDVNADGYADLVVGANTYGNPIPVEGQALVFHGSAAGPSATPSWTMSGGQFVAQLGTSVATAGDVDGDGFDDVLIGAPAIDAGQMDEGLVILGYGSPAGIAGTWTAECDQASASLGGSVAGAGDVNGDGFADLVAGARRFDNGQVDEGRAFVFHGSATGPVGAWINEGNQASAQFGTCVAGAGDTNGDGFSDVVIAAPGFDNGSTDEGRAFLYQGSASGLGTATWIAEGDQNFASYGSSVAGAGDVNGDGYSDVIVGAPGFSSGESAEGRAFVYLGGGCVSASATAYGTSKAGTNGPPALSSSTPPKLGGLTDVTITGGLPGASPVLLFVGSGPASLPFDKGTLWVITPLFTLVLPALDGTGSRVVPALLPGNPALCGLHLYMQAMFADPGAIGAYHTAQTNGLHWTLGS